MLERTWERRFQELFDRQRDSIIARLEGKRGRQLTRAAAPDPQAAYNRQYWESVTEQLSQDLYEIVMGAAGAALDLQFGIDFTLDAPYAQEWIQARANHLAGVVTETTYDAVKAQLTEGAAAGDSIPNLADRIRTLFDQTYANRAQTVARTEVISGYNGSTYTVSMQSDVIAGMEWLATLDKRVRPSHKAMNGKIVTKGEAFELDGAVMRFPGDPNVQTGVDSNGEVPDPGSMIINCRCTIAPLTAADMPTDRAVPAMHLQEVLVSMATGGLTFEEASRALARQAIAC